MNEDLLQTINNNLEVIIALLLQSLPGSDNVHLRQRIVLLSGLGVRPKDIARVLGKTESHVGKELSLNRKSKKKTKGQK